MEPAIKRIPLLKSMKKDDMDLLNPLFENFSCQAGTIVLQQGMPADYLYFVLKGKVEISYKPYDGTHITVSHVAKDGLFGWSSVVGSKTYTSSATAIEDLEAVRIHGRDLRKFCVNHPEIGKDILEKLASSVSTRWQDANEQVRSILEHGIKKR